ncbi:MAG: prephenate dehydrogenase [Candidatus Hydrogenedentota bacterium]
MIALGGVGLMGGSLGLRLKALPSPPRVAAFGRTEKTLRRAQERGAIDSWSLDPAEAVRDADIVVLCAPVRTIPEQMTAIAQSLKPGAIVTDVGSTKEWIIAEAARRLPKGVRFVGSHPMAGSERDGIDAADPALYEQAVVIVTPSTSSDEEALERVKELWRQVGAQPVVLPADAHDRVVASISHMPHVAAALLVNTVAARAKRDSRTTDLAAGGFRDTTRIASSNPGLWRDICLTNRKALLDALDEMHKSLAEFRIALNRNDEKAIESFFTSAKKSRDAVPPKGVGLLPSIIDLFVELADKPGAIAEVTGVLARQDVNIADIEIAHVRGSDDEAPLRLLFDTVNARDRAARALTSAGYTIRMKG